MGAGPLLSDQSPQTPELSANCSALVGAGRTEGGSAVLGRDGVCSVPLSPLGNPQYPGTFGEWVGVAVD